MLISIVIRSKDEASRLRLALTSLARQTMSAEVIVVDDGSSDATSAVLSEAGAWLPVRILRHATPRGRSGASNAGALAAKGDILLFLDGDTLFGPDCVALHAAEHRASHGANLIGRGETYHLRCTRYLQDPESGAPRPDAATRIARLTPTELARMTVTRDDVQDRFAGIERRAEPGIYPGAGPRRLYELERDALRDHPGCPVLWAAASGANLSVRRDAFLRCGGFDEALEINEHREFALRLCRDGARMTFVDGARSFHLTHRAGWRDPLGDAHWEQVFYRRHPLPEVKLLSVFWASLAKPSPVPPEAQIRSLPELAAAALGRPGIDYDAIRQRIGSLADLRDCAPVRAA